MPKIPQYIDEMLELLYPRLCISCGERLISQEEYLCMNCWFDLPVSRFHTDPENKVAQLFWGRVRIENASSYFQYRKGSRYQQVIHFIKYKGLKELGYETGKRYGEVLATSESFSRATMVVPVPLHQVRQNRRGYNQSEWIAMGIADAMKKPLVADNLTRVVYTSTQTRKTRYERWQNVEGIFCVKKPEVYQNQHILLIDDVVTTGSTLEACAHEILKTEGVKVSIATLAYADL
jgi:ComF family protein